MSNKNVNLFLLLTVAIVLLYLLRRCSDSDREATTQTITTIHIDTLTVRDTVYFHSRTKWLNSEQIRYT